MGRKGWRDALSPFRMRVPDLLDPVALDAAPFPAPPIRSVYVHAPFCARRCGYCDFAVTVARTGDVAAWLAGLAGELVALADEGLFVLDSLLDTLYVGGGTPSLLGPEAMAGLGGLLGSDRLGNADLEWTAEANPESFTPEVARAWSEAGVNRISLGLQTFHEPALAWMGRLHRPEEGVAAVETIRRAGFENYSVDLIFGLPERLERPWSDDLEGVLRMDPPHVSLYGLSVEAETPLGRSVAEGEETPASEMRYTEEYLEAAERLAEAGYEHYEVSNFARPGFQALHNSVYWMGLPYLGLGNGSHSYLHPRRRWNVRDWGEYVRLTGDGELPMAEEEVLEPASVRLERVWLALRTRRGVSQESLPAEALDLMGQWVAADLAKCDEGICRLTPLGWLSTDRLTLDLDGLL
ncbi:MAG: radical SAM family heme chaperone HemW [Longimicrobiales bacterium]